MVSSPYLFEIYPDEGYASKHIVGLVRQVLGTIDLDPCSDELERPNIPAQNHFTDAQDGLLRELETILNLTMEDFAPVLVGEQYGLLIVRLVSSLSPLGSW